MKIGIMSMQRIKNYGSFLQAYGLKKTLNELGFNNVEFIDYKIGKPIMEIKKRPFFIRAIKKLQRMLHWKKNKYKRDLINEYNYRYNNEFLKILNISEERNYNHDLDYLIIGSDEVFNCTQTNPDVGYSLELFGQGYNEKSKVISYAACFGGTNYDKLKMYGVNNEIAELLKKFKSISVRDKNSYETTKRLTGIKPVINLDPVLVSNIEIPEDTKKVQHKDYIIVYAYTDRINKQESKVIKEFAKKYNKKIISIGTYQNCADIHLVLNPFEMLEYIKNADYIITDTFHGTIFSVKYNKKFATIIRDSNKEKLGDLLERLKLKNRSLNNIEDLEKVIKKDIDYKITNSIIEEEKIKTREYLKENLK